MVLQEEQKKRLLSENQASATRSSGPGGQNVNKVNTKIELRFSIENSDVLTDEQKQTLYLKLKNRINSMGELIVTASAERSQWKNRLAAENKFIELIEKALTPQKRRKKTRPTKASKLKRLENKKRQSVIKANRKPPEI